MVHLVFLTAANQRPPVVTNMLRLHFHTRWHSTTTAGRVAIKRLLVGSYATKHR
jgi:hypothetical protein